MSNKKSIIWLMAVILFAFCGQTQFCQAKGKVARIEMDRQYDVQSGKDNYDINGLDKSGKKVWTYQLKNVESVEPSPVAVGASAKYAYIFHQGRFLKLNKQTGKKVLRTKRYFPKVTALAFGVDSKDNLYAQDSFDEVVMKISPKGKILWKTNMKRTGNVWAGEVTVRNKSVEIIYNSTTNGPEPNVNYVVFDKETGRIIKYTRNERVCWEPPVVKKSGSKYKNAVKAYRKFLSRSTVKLSDYLYADSQYIKFRLHDINKDGVPELLCEYLAAAMADGNFHIVSIVNGKIKSIKVSYRSVFSFYQNAIIEENGFGRTLNGQGAWKSIYKYNGKSLKELASNLIEKPDIHGDGRESEAYKIEGKKVSKERFIQYEKKLKKGKKVDFTKGLRMNTAKNRRKMR